MLLAIGLAPEIAHGSIRFTLGHDTTKVDLDYAIEKLPDMVNNLREISPMDMEFEND